MGCDLVPKREERQIGEDAEVGAGSPVPTRTNHGDKGRGTIHRRASVCQDYVQIWDRDPRENIDKKIYIKS